MCGALFGPAGRRRGRVAAARRAGRIRPATPGASTEQLPAAPLLIAAYAFVWVAAMGYVWTIARRLNKVEGELRALAQKATRTSR